MLRDRIGLQIRKSTRGALVHSVAAFAFDLVRSDAEHRGVEPPRLRSGADVDQDILDLLTEHHRSGSGPEWPESLAWPVRQTEVFRTELRELIARLTERGLGGEQLRLWSEVHPAWAAAADFVDDYLRVIARSRPHEFDSAEMLRLATSLADQGLAHRRGLRAVLVDDFQDVSPATVELLLALHRTGVHVGVFAEPDVAGLTFRGSDPEGPVRLAQQLGVTPIVFDRVFRHGPALRGAVSDITSRIGTALAGQQRRATAVATDHPEALLSVTSPSPAREASDIARILRSQQVERKVAYSDMAVVVRRASAISPLAQVLQQAGIPTETDFRTPLSSHPASRELIGWIRLALQPEQVTSQMAAELLTGLYGGMSRRHARRLAHLLRAIDSADGVLVSASDSLAATLREATVPLALPESWHAPLHRVTAVLAGLRALPPSATPDLLASTAWQLWAVEDDWVARAIDPLRPSLFFRESVNQVGALLRTAERWVRNHQGVSAMTFFDAVSSAEVAEDVLLPAVDRVGVTITTPAAIAGDEFRVVWLASVNEHVWPNTRIRGSLLGAPLVQRAHRGVVDEPIDDQRVVIDDELRMAALAVSRASEVVGVSAVDSDDSQPSPLFHLLSQRATIVPSSSEERGSSRALVGSLRRHLVGGDLSAADALAYLHRHQVPGAHPDTWWGLSEPSSATPLFAGEIVPISPSKIGKVEDSPLDWFLDRIAPEDLPPTVGVGSLLHFALEHAPNGTREELADLVTKRFGELDFESGWQAAAHHRRALDYVVALADYLRDREAQGATVVASEQKFRIELDGAIVTGVIDRVEKTSDGQLVVVDLKTGKPVSDNAVVDDPQLSAYQLALHQGELAETVGREGAIHGAWLLFVREGKDQKRYRLAAQNVLDDQTLDAFRQRIAEAAAKMSAAVFDGPRVNSFGGSSVSSHRWQRVQAVCGD